MLSKKARKQRKELFNAPLHKKRKWIASHLEEKLLLKYDRRSMPVIKGDTVKVMRGSFKGHEDKVSRVNVSRRFVEVEGLTLIKADGKKIAKPIHPSKLLITKLNLTDKWRRQKLERGVSEEVKKEIEKEAEAQIKEQEEEKKKAELEAEETEKEEQEELPEETEEKPEKTKATPTEKKPVKTTTTKKPEGKKTTKKPVKKPPVKKPKKKEEKK